MVRFLDDSNLTTFNDLWINEETSIVIPQGKIRQEERAEFADGVLDTIPNLKPTITVCL